MSSNPNPGTCFLHKELLQSQVQTKNSEYELVCVGGGGGGAFCFILFHFWMSLSSLEGKQVLNCLSPRRGSLLEAAAVAGAFLPAHLKQAEGKGYGKMEDTVREWELNQVKLACLGVILP